MTRDLLDEAHIEPHLAALTRRCRRQARTLQVLALLWLVTTAAIVWHESIHARAENVPPNSVLRVRGLVVQDDKGMDRIWIGAPLPDAMVLGKRYRRSVIGSGILILDPEGNERGGYATFEGGNANLSVDSLGDEVADFGSDAEGNASASLRNGKGDAIGLKVTDHPQIQMTRDGKLVFDEPKPNAGKN